MTLGIQIVGGWLGFVTLFGLGMMGWAIYSGQYDDPDALNRIPFNEKEPEDWPGRTTIAKEV